MSIREEQCRKVCRILDDVLANRPTERDSLIVATRNAFSALSAPCEDAVSRKAVIDTIDEWKEACAGSGHKETVSDIKLIRKDFIDLPSVTPKQRTGEWIDDGSELGCQCSECGKSLDEYIHATECMTLIEIPKFCPNCGAKMEGGAE